MKKQMLIIIFIAITACSVLPGTKSLDLDVYKLRLTEILQKNGDDITTQDLPQELAKTIDTSSDKSSERFKDATKAKSVFRQLAKVYENGLQEVNGLAPPVGLESKHDKLKAYFQTMKDLLNEINGFPDDNSEFSKKVVVQSVKISQAAEDAVDILKFLELNVPSPSSSNSSSLNFSPIFPTTSSSRSVRQVVNQTVVVNAQPTPTSSPLPTPSPTPRPTPTPLPIPTLAAVTSAPFVAPSASATPTPTPLPTSQPSTATTAAPSVAPTPTPTPTPLPHELVNGKVFGASGAALDGATVRIRSLSSSVVYEAEVTTTAGTYLFVDAPVGIQVEITASKNGFSSKTRTETVAANPDGRPDVNNFDFGSADGSGSFGLQPN